MNYWENEICEYCRGAIIERRVTLNRIYKGRYVIIENVPAGVCVECGTRYFTANVLKTVEEHIRGRTRAKRNVIVPVYAL